LRRLEILDLWPFLEVVRRYFPGGVHAGSIG
jgi:hypothetical protein